MNIKVLILDELGKNAQAMSPVLREAGLQVFIAASKPEVLKIMANHEIQLALIDFDSESYNALEMGQLLRSFSKPHSIPLIFLVPMTNYHHFSTNFPEMNSVDFIFTPANSFIVKCRIMVFVNKIIQNNLLALKIKELEAAKNEAIIALRTAENADRLKSSFLANMSHEIRTPLGALMGFAELLKKSDLTEDQKKNYINIIVDNGHNLIELIDEILDLSKVESGHLEVENTLLSPRSTIEEIIKLLRPLAEKNQVQFEVSFSKGVPENICSDQKRFRQIMTNIIGNAYKFTKNGLVKIHVDYIQHQSIPELKIVVEDNGIGVEKEKLNRLFQSFSQVEPNITTRFGGSGLGLALSKKLANLLYGDVTLLWSEPQKGSAFQVIIRDQIHLASQIDMTSHYQQEFELSAKASLEGLDILVVDDSEDNLLLVKTILEGMGARIDLAENGMEAIEKAAKKMYHVILMDFQMPICDGLEATRILRKRGYFYPIVALTANAMKDERERFLKAGSNEYLSKPINWDRLVQVIVRLSHSYKRNSTFSQV